MRPKPFALFLSFLTTLSLTGCHRTSVQRLPGTAHPAYTITDLGAGLPSGINNRGQVVGMYAAGVFPNSKKFPYFHGCLWDKGKRINMPTLGGWYSNAVKITDGDQIIGTATIAGKGRTEADVTRTCLWNGHRLTDLDADPHFRGTSALHITKSGAVYAVSPPQGPQKQFHLWLYPSGFGPGVRRDVGIIGGPKIKPLFINDSGMVAGTWKTGEKHNMTDTDGVHRAFVWHPGDKKWIDLGTFGGRDSEPAALNNAGQVIGDAMLTDDPVTHIWRDHAFLWEEGRMKDLGAPPGDNSSRAVSINTQGQIVGYSVSEIGGLKFRPLLWEHGQIKDLSLLIPSGTLWGDIGSVAGINDRGQIVGDGSIPDPSHHAHGYLLTPR